MTNFVLFPLLAKRYAAPTLFIANMAFLAPLIGVVPFLPALCNAVPALTWPLLITHNALMQACATIPFTAVGKPD